ncbi:MAG TPA: PorT family protein [Petrimonas sp.]|uniref:porin family protein n=1 Tax=Petrimonas sp. TaxID=2023866 RepID=UPI00175D6D7F|nr:porin family protein [Petrimonas sp.]MEA5045438.1 porin family protein [Petrimonas sp.]MEA5062966.1 porin family protein [Petrimonas sp.]HHV85788.1 PorT family protein [Petrimonas sp.]
MRKTILVCLSFLMATGLMSVSAQTSISYGIKGEMNLSNFFLKDLDTQTSTMKVGPNLGGFMKIDLHPNFAIQPEVMFFYRNSKMETGPAEDTFKQWGMQIPVYALGQTEAGNGRFYGGVGPYVGFGFDARYKDADVSLYKKVNDKTPMNRWDFGLGALLGYEFNNGVQLNAGYQFGFVDQLDAMKDDASMRTQTVNIGIGYRF